MVVMGHAFDCGGSNGIIKIFKLIMQANQCLATCTSMIKSGKCLEAEVGSNYY